MNLSHPKHGFPCHTLWPCHVSPASRQDGMAVPSKMSSPAASPPHCQTGGLPHTSPHCQSSCRAASGCFLLQCSPHDEIKLRASQHEDTKEGRDSTIHHRGKSVLQCCSRAHVPAPRSCQEALNGMEMSLWADPMCHP